MGFWKLKPNPVDGRSIIVEYEEKQSIKRDEDKMEANPVMRASSELYLNSF